MQQVTDRQRVALAFRELRKRGWVARMNFMCCQTCAGAESAQKHPDAKNVVYFHQQDNEAFLKDGNLLRGSPLWLAHRGDAIQVYEELRKAGLSVAWNGSRSTRIRCWGRHHYVRGS